MTDLQPATRTRSTIQRVLHSAKTIAVVGLSGNELRASYFVGYYLKRHGYRVIPVNPRETRDPRRDVATRACATSRCRSTSSTSSARPTRCPSIAREAVAIGAGALWCQFGVINDEGNRIAEDGGPRPWSWTAASRSSTRGTSAGCTGSASTPSGSRRCAPACSSGQLSSAALAALAAARAAFAMVSSTIELIRAPLGQPA